MAHARSRVRRTYVPLALSAGWLFAAACGGRVIGDGDVPTDDAATLGDSSAFDTSISRDGGVTPTDDASIGPGRDASTGFDTAPGTDAPTVIDAVVDAARETGVTKCKDDGACAATTPRCDTTTGTCAGCTAKSCSPFGAVCDPASGACVECVTTADCGGGRVCDVPSHSCTRTCSSATPCRGGFTCDPASGTCVECTRDADCRGGRCEPGTHVCVECLTAGDCRAPTPICDPVHTCTLTCTTEAQCAPFRAHCDLSVGRCFECYRNDQCNSGEFCQADRTCGGG